MILSFKWHLDQQDPTTFIFWPLMTSSDLQRPLTLKTVIFLKRDWKNLQNELLIIKIWKSWKNGHICSSTEWLLHRVAPPTPTPTLYPSTNHSVPPNKPTCASKQDHLILRTRGAAPPNKRSCSSTGSSTECLRTSNLPLLIVTDSYW